MSHDEYLQEMGISTWHLRQGEMPQAQVAQNSTTAAQPDPVQQDVKSNTPGLSPWVFIVDDLTGDAALLFERILASLYLTRSDIQCLSSQQMNQIDIQSAGVVEAMGSLLPKKLLQIDEAFEEIRGTVESVEISGHELPIVFTDHPAHLLKHAQDKAKTWQDLILARSLII